MSQAHLTQMFSLGKPLTVYVERTNEETREPETVAVELWMRKPTTPEYQQATAKAGALQARRRARYKDKESDEYMALQSSIDEVGDTEEILGYMLDFKRVELQQQAYHEVLYAKEEGEDGKDVWLWGENGSEYLDLLAGIQARSDEIKKYNDMVEIEEEKIFYESDEEMIRLNAQVDKFAEQRQERLDKLTEIERAALSQKSDKELRAMLTKRMVDLDVNSAFTEEFKNWMVYFSVRYGDDHSKRYFKDPNDIAELPDYVKIQIYTAYDQIDIRSEDLKN